MEASPSKSDDVGEHWRVTSYSPESLKITCEKYEPKVQLKFRFQ